MGDRRSSHHIADPTHTGRHLTSATCPYMKSVSLLLSLNQNIILAVFLHTHITNRYFTLHISDQCCQTIYDHIHVLYMNIRVMCYTTCYFTYMNIGGITRQVKNQHVMITAYITHIHAYKYSYTHILNTYIPIMIPYNVRCRSTSSCTMHIYSLPFSCLSVSGLSTKLRSPLSL